MTAEPTLFPVDPVPEGKPPREFPVFGDPVPRPQGWGLFANRLGPMGYHHVESSGMNGLAFATCGVIGRLIPGDQREIICCPDCMPED